MEAGRSAVRDLRGNVGTRLRKLAAGDVDAIVLAAAGLRRLDVWPDRAELLDPDVMVPAPGQGALAVQARSDDAATLETLHAVEHAPSRAAFDAERVAGAPPRRRLRAADRRPGGAVGQQGARHGRRGEPRRERRGSRARGGGRARDAADAAARELLDGGAKAILDALGREA